MDASTITAALAGVKHALDIAGTLKSADVSLEKAEYKLKVAELVSALAGIKIEIANLQEVLLAKDAENRRLKEKIETEANMDWEHPYYWMKKDGSKHGPFCGQCWDSKRLPVRLVSTDKGAWHCNTCRTTVTDKDFVPYSPPALDHSGGHWMD